MLGQIMSVWDAAARGDLAVVRSLIEDKGRDLNERGGPYSWAPLRYAAEKGHLPVVEYLLERGTDVDTKAGDGWTPLRWAAREGHLFVVEYVLEGGADVNVKDWLGRTPLLSAASNGHLPVVEYLVESGADVNVTDICNGYAPLLKAASNGHLPVVEYLVERGADVNAKNRFGSTSLMNAAENGRLPVVEYLLKRGEDVKAHRSPNGDTVLHLVCANLGERGRAIAMEMAAMLLQHGEDHLAVNQQGETALKILSRQFTGGNEAKFMEELQKAGLIVAVKTGDVAEVRRLVEQEGMGVNGNDHEGTSLLVLAARRGDMVMFEYLVEKGADEMAECGCDEVATMVQRRHEWIEQAVSIAARWHLPLVAVRTIHEYVVGFHWSAVCAAFASASVVSS